MTVCPLCLVKLCACFCCFLFACVSLFHLGPFELTHYCIPFLCSEHFLSPAIDMSSSQGGAASASSSSAQPPKPVQQLPEPDLELEGELIDHNKSFYWAVPLMLKSAKSLSSKHHES